MFLLRYLWIAPHVLLLVVLLRLLWQRREKRLPVFFAYTIFELVQFLASVLLYLQTPFPRATYRWLVMVCGGTVNSLLVLGVIYELANELVLSRIAAATALRRVLSASLVVLLLAAAIASGALSHGRFEMALNVYETLDFSTSLIEAGMLVVLLLFARTLAISWSNWLVGIALGFGVSASIDLGSAAWRATYGRAALIPVDVIQMIAYHLCVLIWLIYMFLPDRKPPATGSGLKKRELELWNREIEKMVRG
jgi:hypothetical protein